MKRKRRRRRGRWKSRNGGREGNQAGEERLRGKGERERVIEGKQGVNKVRESGESLS